MREELGFEDWHADMYACACLAKSGMLQIEVGSM